MGALRQLGSLFWKNYVIRKRHPAILLLEILWPVLIFVLVGFLRTGIPPKSDETCSYPERALPGDDLVPFLQSSVCSLDNNCKKPQAIAEDLSSQQRFQAMIADISPILTKNTTINAVKALPTVQKVLQVARDITNRTDLDDLDNRLILRNMVSDPNMLLMLLTDKYKVMSQSAAEDLLDSSLNIVELISNIGTVDFNGTVCDPEKLKNYLLFPREVDIDLISQSLCEIDNTLISNITNDLIRMLDIPNIIRLAEDFANVMGAFDYAVLMEDLADMVELLQGRSALASVFTDFTFLSLAPAAFRDLAKLMPILTSMEDIDFQSLEALYEIVKPMLLTVSDDAQVVDTINDLLEAGNTLLQSFSDPNTDWSIVIMELLPLLNETDILIEDNSTIGTIFNSIPDLSVYIDILVNNETVSADAVLAGMSQQGSDMAMRMIMGDNATDTMMIIGFGLMDMMDMMMDFFDEMDSSLRYSIETTSGMGEAMVTLNSLGSEKTGEFLEEILSVENIRNVYNGTSAQAVCTEAVDDVFVYLSTDMLAEVKDSVCSVTVTDIVEKSMSTEKFNELKGKMEEMMEEMENMLEGRIPLRDNMTMDEMSERMTEMVIEVSYMLTNMTMEWDATLMKVVPDYRMVYDKDWREMWMGLGEEYVKSNVLTQLEVSFRTLEKTTLWKSVDNVFLMADALMASLRKFMGIVGSFTDPDSTLYTFAAHIKYLPEVIEGFVKNANLFSKVFELENMENITAVVDVVCDVNWADLNVSSDVPLDNIENLICNTNWTSFMDTIFVELNPLALLKEIEDVYMNGYSDGINWSQMIDDLDYHLSLITNGEVMRYIDLWTSVDLGIENMGRTLERMLEYIMNMGAGETITSYKEIIISSLENLDRQMGDMDTWNQVKHYVYVVVAYHKVINRYLADSRVSGFNATLYIKDISPTLGDFLLQSASTVPELLDGVQYAISNIYNTMNILLAADYMDLCSTINIDQLLQLPNNDNVTKFKEELCALNWTLIGEEFMENDDNLQQLILELDKLNSNTSLEPIHLNWTDVVSTVEQFITLMEDTVSDEQSLMWDALNLEAVNGSYTDLANNIWNLPEYDVNWSIQAMNRLAELLYQQNDPMMEELMTSIASQTYMNHHITVFLNKQLEYFTARTVVDLRAYVSSAEMDKIFDVMVKSPELVKIMRVNIIKILETMDTKSLESLGDLLDICNDTQDTLTAIEIPADVTMTSKELQTLVCGLNVNGSKLMEELYMGLDGLEALVDSIEFLGKENLTADDLYIDLTIVQASTNKTSQLIEQLINNPPNITIGSTELLKWVDDVVGEFEIFIENISSVDTNTENVLGSIAASQQQLTTLYMSLVFSDGGMNDILRIMDMYTIVLEHMLKDVEGFLLDPDEGFRDYPEMKKVWELLEQGPYVMETFIYTSVVDNSKISRVTSLVTEGVEKLCAANPDDLMTVPPKSSFNFTDFFNHFCSINMTSFEEEYRRFIMYQNISDTYDTLYSNTTREVNMTALTERIQSLMEDITNMTSEGDTYQLPQFMNETLWTAALEYVSELLVDNTSLTDSLLAAQQQSMSAALTTLNEIGGISGLLRVAELYMALIDKMVVEGKDLLTAPGLGLTDYPEMYTVWELMDYLPQVMETFIYTSYMDNQKLTRVTELATEGIEKLCEANPDDLMTVPPASSFNFTEFFHKFCSINMTALEEEYANFTNREEISSVWDNVMEYNRTVNVTHIMDRYDSIMSHLNDLMSDTTAFDLPQFLNTSAWEKALETITGFYANDTNWLDALLIAQQQSTAAALSSLNQLGGINGILRVSELYTMLFEKMVLEGKDLVNVSSMGLADYPEMYTVWELMQELPEVMETFIYTSYMDNLKLSRVIELIFEGVDKLCVANPDDLMTVPPASSFNFTAFFHKFCSINMTALEEEYANFTNREEISSVWDNLMEYNETVNVTDLMERSESLMSHLEDLMSDPEAYNLPRFLNSSVWDRAFETIMGFYADNTDWIQSLTTTSGLEMINDTDMYRVGLTVDLGLDLMIERLEEISENITIETLTRGAPDLVLMMKSMASLNTALKTTTLKDNIDEDKVMALAMDPETMMKFCENNSLAAYIQIADSMSTVATDIQNILCVVMDTETLLTSLQDQVDYKMMEEKLMNIWNMSNTDLTYDWDMMTVKLTTVMNLLTNITSSPPPIDPILSEMLDMDSILKMLSEMASSPALYAALSNSLAPLTGDQALDASGISSVVMYIIELFEENDWTIPITALLPNSTLMAQYIQEIFSVDSYQTMMLATLDPEQFWMLVLSGDWVMTVCDPAKFAATFTFPEGLDVAQLQKDLCEASTSQNLNGVFRSIDVAEITNELSQYVTDLVSQNSTVDAPMTIEALANYTATILSQLMSTDNSQPFNLEEYLKPITDALTSIDQSYYSIALACNQTTTYIAGTGPYQSALDEYLHTVYLSLEVSRVYFAIQNDLGDVLCDPDSKNVSILVMKMKEKEIPEKLQFLAEVYMGKYDMSAVEFTCEGLAALYVNYTDLTTSSIDMIGGLINESSKTMECVNDAWSRIEDLLVDMSRLFAQGSQIVNILRDDQFQQFIFTIVESNQTLEILGEIVTLYRDQQNNIDAVRDALQSNVTSLLTLFENNYNIAPDILRTFVNSTFSQDFANKTDEEILDHICNSTRLEDAIELDSNFVNLKEALCGDDREVALQTVGSLASLGSTLDELQGLPVDSQEFYEVLTRDLAELVSNIQGISELGSIIGNLQDIDITNLEFDNELLDTLQRILVDNGPDDLYASLDAVISNFADIDGESSSEIVTGMRVVTEGLFAFKSLRNLFVQDVKVSDLVKDSDELTKYMKDVIGLPTEVAEAITDGSISFKTLLDASQMNVTDWVCNSTQLAKLIEMSENATTNVEYISEQFCALDSDTVSKILEEVIVLVDVGDLMEEYVENSFYSQLSTQNVSIEDTKESLASVQLAQDDLRILIERADEYTAQIPNAVASLTAAQLDASQSMSSLTSVLCGREIDNLGDEFGLGSSVKSDVQLTDEQIAEMNNLPGEYCQDMYKEIMESESGPVIWAYLKPLLRGKILYAPNTGAIDAVIKEMNSTFIMIQDVVDQARDWARGSSVFEEVTGEKGTSLQEILDSKLVGAVITDVAGMSVEEIKDLVFTLNGTDADLAKGLSSIAQFVADYVDCIDLDRFVGFEMEQAMNEEAARLHGSNSLMAGLVFDSDTTISTGRKKRQTVSNLPKHVKYRIRMDIDNVQHTYRLKERMWRPKPEDSLSADLRYIRGFIQLQQMIDSAIISAHVGKVTDLPLVTTKQFPFPCHKEDLFVNAFAAYLLPILMTIAWLAGISVAVYNLVYDRENGQEETLKAMGLVGTLNWWAWFLSTMLISSAIAFITAVILKYWDVFTHSNLLLIFLFFVDFIFSAVMLCYFISAFFTRTALAILSSLIVYLVSYLPYVILISLEVEMEFWQKFLACLSSTTAFSFGAHFIARYEEQQIGVQWSNVADSPLHDDNFSFHWACIMMVIDGGIYLILGWYVRNVKPGKFGISQPWYFPVSPSYWGCGSKSSKSNRNNHNIFSEELNTDYPVVISMKGLSKTFSGRRAVDNLSLDIHAGHVTALLGHNGAAKTTTMNMLIGVLEPSSGEVRIFNRPQHKMRESIGVCPQHNALFEYMTVKEHMEFYASMKSSYPGQSYRDEIKELLKDVDLWYVRHARVKELSGGMQRRLCVALAFVGGSRAVILDEPTSGVDPSGRRAIWNLIIKRKLAKENKEAAILLSTHHLDEADVLGDTIAIMHEGKLLCNGSPIFLKQHLTQGHRLTVIKEPGTQEYDTSAILSRLQRWVPMTRLQQTVGNEMTFVLPSTNSEHFYNLLKDLEISREELSIDSYGVSDPTLEEVFLKVCKTADVGQEVTPAIVKNIDAEVESQSNKEWKQNMEDEDIRKEYSHKVHRVGGASLKFQQFGALLTKRFNHYRRNWRVFISVLILPLLLFLVASGFYYIKPKGIEAPSVLLTPATYGPDSYVFYKRNEVEPLFSSVIDSFEHSPGIGTSCMLGFTPKGDQYECIQEQSEYSGLMGMPVGNRTCSCNDYEFSCTGSLTPPRSLVTTTTDILQDLENRDVDEYLIDSFHDYVEKRYGGWSFEKDDKDKLKAKIWFNNKGHHALPSFLNAYSNGLLRALVNETHGSAAEFGISAYTHPYLFSKEQLDENTLLQHAADAGIALTILLAYTFFPVGVMMYVVMENLNKDKHIQSISGVGSVMYWLAAILWDVFVLIIAVACTFGIMAIFQHESFWNRENAAATVALLLLYGWSTIPFTYCMVKLFKSVASAFFSMFCLFNFIGIASVSIIFVIIFYDDTSATEFGDNVDIAKKVLLIFPQYALAGGLLDLIANEIKTTIFAKFNTDVYVSPFSFDMIAWNLIVLGAEGLLFFIIAVLLEIRCNSCTSANSKSAYSNDVYEDVDVLTEKRRIQEGRCREDILVVRDLHKIYPTRDVYAVSGLTFGVPGGQCFGLLGVNGAGKSTTFKILTGTIEATRGEAWLLGNSVKNASTFGKTIGYCPQEDALDSFLSVEEMLAFHCRIKGIPGEQHKDAIHDVMDKLSLHSFKDKTVKSCSGGMKRKLSLAIALLGDPSIVLLDEPTTGMDPKAKRLVWDCLLNAKKNGQAIVLTSHSLEECDILCDRIAIMVNGEFKCLGSSQHLKNKFGDGYTVTLNVDGLSTVRQTIQELVQKHFPGATIRDQHQRIVQLDIPKHSTNVSDIFGVLEEEKHRYNIVYYTVSQTTLDTIFLNFARDQGDGNGTDIETGSSSIESYSDDVEKSTSSIPTAYYAYQNRMYDTYGDSEPHFKNKLVENKYHVAGTDNFVTKL